MNIVVLSGGISTERDVSLSSGSLITKALVEASHDAVFVDLYLGFQYENDQLTHYFKAAKGAEQYKVPQNPPSIAEVKQMRDGKIQGLFGENVLELCKLADIVFIALHGEDGENGKIQAVFDLFHIRYTGTGYMASAVAMDKYLSKCIMESKGLLTPRSCYIKFDVKQTIEESIETVVAKAGLPCIVKPNGGGSSVGISIAKDKTELKISLEEAFRYDANILIEEYINGREFSVGLLEGKALPVIELIPKTEFYNYENKYQQGMTEEICPADISDEETSSIQKSAEDIYEALGLSNYARLDFMQAADGMFYCLEANTLPGMTPTSLLPQQAAAMGMDFVQLCEEIVQIGLRKYKDNPR